MTAVRNTIGQLEWNRQKVQIRTFRTTKPPISKCFYGLFCYIDAYQIKIKICGEDEERSSSLLMQTSMFGCNNSDALDRIAQCKITGEAFE